MHQGPCHAQAAPVSGVRYGPGSGGTSHRSGNVPGQRMGGGMMGAQQVGLAGDGVAVRTIAQARARAAQAATTRGLSAGEVMQFSDNFFVELKDAAGNPTTEVLVGPAMMWNTNSRNGSISPDQARTIADDWLRANLAGQSAVADVKEFPGYDTIDTEKDGHTLGMLSVNTRTGAVWHHTRHGTFIAEEDD